MTEVYNVIEGIGMAKGGGTDLSCLINGASVMSEFGFKPFSDKSFSLIVENFKDRKS